MYVREKECQPDTFEDMSTFDFMHLDSVSLIFHDRVRESKVETLKPHFQYIS